MEYFVLCFIVGLALIDFARSDICTDPNAHWSDKYATNCQNTCERPDLALYCKPAKPVAGCVCNIGYLKSKDGTCLSSKKCAVIGTCEDPNAEYSKTMATGCQNTCQSPNFQSICTPTGPQAGCVCKTGFVKNKKDRCVTLRECEPKKCPTNLEIWSDCSVQCQPTCENPGPVKCTRVCKPGCVCKENLVRAASGACIPPSKCPKKCKDPNTSYSETGAHGCQNTCENPTRSMVCNAIPKAGCICNDDCLRNSKGICVKKEHCENKKCDDPNARYSETEAHGCQNTCANPTLFIACTAMPMPGCVCIENYLKNDKGVCVKKEDCDKCKGPNEQWSRNVDCSCADLDKCIKTKNDLRPTEKPGCRCIDGYVRDENNVCIKAGFCKRCPPMEKYTDCGTACPKTCQNKDIKMMCIMKCVSGCFCADGRVRNDKGLCVDPSECPNVCGTDPNSEFLPCGDVCPRTCDNPSPKVCLKICKAGGGCGCKPGFVKGPNGKCIPPSQCPRCGKDEMYDACGSPCQTACATLNDTCSIVNKMCNSDCYCKKGYARNSYGRCISVDQCNCLDGCRGDPNARKVKKPEGSPVTCATYDGSAKPYSSGKSAVSHSGYEQCECDWKKGYIIDETTGYCVNPKDCHKCKGANEVWGNGINVSCKDLQVDDIVGVLHGRQYIKGCYCKDGHVRNAVGVCIPAHKCRSAKTCDANEVWKCPKYCAAVTCDEKGRMYKCVGQTQEQKDSCTPACVCRDNYLRNDKGKCVDPKKCPAVKYD